MKTFKNVTESLITHAGTGFKFPVSEEVEFSEADLSLMRDDEMGDLILNGDIVVMNGEVELKPALGYSEIFTNSVLSSSLAVDKNGTDQSVSDGNWNLVTSTRALWDLNEDYDTSEEDFVVPVDGIYVLDLKIRAKEISNCQTLEIALFKRGDPDDYWFIIDRAYPSLLSADEVILSGTISFDFYAGERYCIKVMGTATVGSPSFTLDGDDDYTAWGYSLSKKLR